MKDEESIRIENIARIREQDRKAKRYANGSDEEKNFDKIINKIGKGFAERIFWAGASIGIIAVIGSIAPIMPLVGAAAAVTVIGPSNTYKIGKKLFNGIKKAISPEKTVKLEKSTQTPDFSKQSTKPLNAKIHTHTISQSITPSKTPDNLSKHKNSMGR